MASITRAVLRDQVKEILLKGILSGQYAPGSRIVETRVARELGVSQGPVREALRDLHVLGLVESTAYQGARVCNPATAELAEAYGVRAELESYGARLALARMTDDDLAELQGCIDEMQRAASTGDTLAEAQIDAAFHGRVIEIASNPTLLRVWQFLEPMSRTYITYVAHQIHPHDIANLHQPILDALVQRDPEAATIALHRHFRIAGEMFADALPSGAGADATPGASLDGQAADGGESRPPTRTPMRQPAGGIGPGTDRSEEHE